jgi:thymidylate kinase
LTVFGRRLFSPSMPLSFSDFARLFFTELDHRGIPYVLLHGHEFFPERIDSDLDFAVRRADLPRLVTIENALAHRHGWRLAVTVKASVHSCFAVLVDPQNPPASVQLDACSRFVTKNCCLLSDSELLENRTLSQGIYIPAPTTEFAYLLTKSLAKGKPISQRLPRLRQLWQSDPAAIEERFRRLFGPLEDSPARWMDKPAEQWEQLRPLLLKRTRMGFADWAREIARRLKRIFRPTGFCLALLGPDGAGKTTLLEKIEPWTRESFFRRTRLFHFRPKVFERQSQGGPVTDPHGTPPRGRLGATAKLFYYYLDCLTGYWVKVFPARVRHELVIFDRSFEDLLIDPRRYRFSRSGKLAQWLSRTLPRADLTLILDADPARIHARKPELPIEELARQRAAFQNLAHSSPRYVIISADAPPEEVARSAWSAITAALEQRETNRHQL